MALSIREMWLELREEVGGPMVWVALVGAIGPLTVGLALGESSWWLFPIPIPLAVASAAARVSDRSGPAISLGALLGYLLLMAFAASPLYPPFYRWVTRGLPSPRVGRIPLSCRTWLPALLLLSWITLLAIYIHLVVFLIEAAWILISAYPAYVARSRFRRVPRLLLIMYAAVLLANAIATASCLRSGWVEYLPRVAGLNSVVDGFLALACLWKALRGGGRDLLTFLTFYVTLGSLLTWWLW